MNIQLHNELEYSKRMRNNLILTDVLDDIPTKITQALTLSIDNYRHNTYYQSKQKRIDNILDKIGKSGYESLSKDEKDFLFRAGK